MAVKTLDNHIKKAFTDLGFTEDEVKNGCWLLEREVKQDDGSKKKIAVAWIALHKFLEKVANKAGINFNLPTVLNCETGEIAVCVEGIDKEGNKAWSIGEASPKNCKNDYRWAMAEKRAKDRVILKLLGIAGDMYSEEEADEFKEKKPKPEFEKEAIAEKTARTKAYSKGEQPKEPEKSLEQRKNDCLIYAKNLTKEEYMAKCKSIKDKFNNLIRELQDKGCAGWLDEVMTEYNRLTELDDKIPY